MIQGIDSSSRGTRIVKDRGLSQLEQLVINCSDWCVSLSKFERFDPDDLNSVLLDQGADWLVSFNSKNMFWEQTTSLQTQLAALTWGASLIDFDQTSGDTYDETVISNGPIWFLPMRSNVDYGQNYFQTVINNGAVWLLDTSQQVAHERLTYVDQIKSVGPVWAIPMLAQSKY